MKTPFPQKIAPPGIEPEIAAALTEAEIELIISALYTLEDAHCRLADRAATEGRKEQAQARHESAHRCLALAEKFTALLGKEPL
jgi:hypothetical protein